jgi:hypothetical protein
MGERIGRIGQIYTDFFLNYRNKVCGWVRAARTR